VGRPVAIPHKAAIPRKATVKVAIVQAMVRALIIRALVVGNKAPLKGTGSRRVVTHKALLADTVEATGATSKVPETSGVGSEGAASSSSNSPNINKRRRRNQALVQAPSPWGLVAVCLEACYLGKPLKTIEKMLMKMDMQMGQAETTLEEVTSRSRPGKSVTSPAKYSTFFSSVIRGNSSSLGNSTNYLIVLGRGIC